MSFESDQDSNGAGLGRPHDSHQTPQGNKAFYCIKVPDGIPQESDFEVRETPLPGPPAAGEIQIRTLVISIDPYLRQYIRSNPVPLLIATHQIAEVIVSSDDKYPTGAYIFGAFPAQLYQNIPTSSATPVDKSLIDGQLITVPTLLGALGLSGYTAYLAHEELQTTKGDVILINGSAGAVGSIAGALAKHLHEAKLVIGVAGGQKKCDHAVQSFGYDVCLDYTKYTGDDRAKTKQFQDDLRSILKDHNCEGIDKYMDQVGGYQTDAVWDILNEDARVSIVGQISEYNDTSPRQVDSFLFKLILKRIHIFGTISGTRPPNPELLARFYQDCRSLITQGKFTPTETVLHGLEKAPEAFIGLFTGANTGKMVVDLQPNNHS